MPLDALLQLPGDRTPSLERPPFSMARDLRGEDRHQVAVAVPAGERLVEDPRAVLVLGADGEMRVEQGRRLPPQHLERAAAAGLGRLVGRRQPAPRHPGMASICAASGAVRPSATIRCTKARRDSRPSFTCAIIPRNLARSSQTPCFSLAWIFDCLLSRPHLRRPFGTNANTMKTGPERQILEQPHTGETGSRR